MAEMLHKAPIVYDTLHTKPHEFGALHKATRGLHGAYIVPKKDATRGLHYMRCSEFSKRSAAHVWPASWGKTSGIVLSFYVQDYDHLSPQPGLLSPQSGLLAKSPTVLGNVVSAIVCFRP